MSEKRQRRKEGRDILKICVGGRHIRAVGCMLEIEGWVAGGHYVTWNVQSKNIWF